jgi:hypothetical protein
MYNEHVTPLLRYESLRLLLEREKQTSAPDLRRQVLTGRLNRNREGPAVAGPSLFRAGVKLQGVERLSNTKGTEKSPLFKNGIFQ